MREITFLTKSARRPFNIVLVDQEIKSVFGNFFFLGIVQATNAIIPLVILPYLLVTLGVEKFGQVAFVQSMMSYLIIVTDYGFNLTSTQKIVNNRGDRYILSQIVTTTLIIKFLLSVACFLILAAIVFLIPQLRTDASLYFLGFSLVVGQMLLPTWFFQGVEKMHYLALINGVAKILFTAMIFVLIVKPADYRMVTVYLSLGNIVAGLFGIVVMFRKFELRISSINFQIIKEELRNGSAIMFSNFAINAYINSNIIVLGIFTNPLVTGFYSIAEKILYCLRQILNLFFQATYPRVCKLVSEGHGRLIKFYKKLFVPFLVLIVMLCLSIFLFANDISRLAIDQNDQDLTLAIKVFSIVPIVICLNIPAYQMLLAYSFHKSAMAVLISGSIANITLNVSLAPGFGMLGTVAAVMITELFITVGLYQVIRTRQLNLL